MARTRKRKRPEPWSEAIEHLRRVDPFWPPVIDRVGPCLLAPMPDRFGTLVRAILSQQISTKAAAAIEARVRAGCGEPFEPPALLRLGESGLRGAGVSRVKARSILDLTEAVGDGRVALPELDAHDDDAVIACLTTVKGIGVWTAEMFLIFALNRPDVLPYRDLGIRSAIRDMAGLDVLPAPAQCLALAEPWRPFRSVASWYLWRNAAARRAESAGKTPGSP